MYEWTRWLTCCITLRNHWSPPDPWSTCASESCPQVTHLDSQTDNSYSRTENSHKCSLDDRSSEKSQMNSINFRYKNPGQPVIFFLQKLSGESQYFPETSWGCLCLVCALACSLTVRSSFACLTETFFFFFRYQLHRSNCLVHGIQSGGLCDHEQVGRGSRLLQVRYKLLHLVFVTDVTWVFGSVCCFFL